MFTLNLISCRDFTNHLGISVLNVRLKASEKLHFIRLSSQGNQYAKQFNIFITMIFHIKLMDITILQDRPDIMAKYTVHIEADKALYPVLLSNGNLAEQGDLKVIFS